MQQLIDSPLLIFVLVAVTLCVAAFLGTAVLRRGRPLDVGVREDFHLILAATLTLLGLIIGFSFSMSMSRYNQRTDCEEAEAAAIGTEFMRADLLSAADAANVRSLLLDYLRTRVSFYATDDEAALRKVSMQTANTRARLWATLTATAADASRPLSGLAVSGMNDVFNAQRATSAAWVNRIPLEAWGLMFLIAVGCNVMLGYNARKLSPLLVVLPILVAIAFMLIADIDSPRNGVIRVTPTNLINLLESLAPH